MGIPIDPTLAANFQTLTPSTSAVGVVSNVTPPEGEFCYPMPFNFQNNKVWEVDLTIPFGQKFSQLRSLYLDATQSTHNFSVYFPDTGFRFDCKSGYSNLVSLPNRRFQYRFYVSLDGQINDPNDAINIIATNVMLPPFNTFNLFKPPTRMEFNRTGISFTVGDLGHQFGAIIAPISTISDLITPPVQFIQSNLMIELVGTNGTPLCEMQVTFTDLFTNQIFRVYNVAATNKHINGSATRDYFFFQSNLNRVMNGTTAFNCGFRIDAAVTKGLVFGAGTSVSCNLTLSPV